MYESIPTELKQLKQWGTFELKFIQERNKNTKIPHNSIDDTLAKTNDSSTWTDFNTAIEALKKFNRDGLAFFFDDGYVGLDIDNIPDDIAAYTSGQSDNEVSKAVIWTDSYTEISQSGKGVHIIFKGKLPEGRRRTANVEMYDSGRFFALTGDMIHTNDELPIIDGERMEKMYEFYFQDKAKQMINSIKPQLNDLSISEIIRRALDSKQGEVFESFLNGGWENKYPSHSEADLAFANMLAFWTGRDFQKMDAIFRSSSLQRQKYDEKHGKTTYGVGLLNKAINETNEVFKPVKPLVNKYILNFNDKETKKTKVYPNRSWDDTGNADRLMDRYGDMIKYSFTDQKWYIYNGTFWQSDDRGLIRELADSVVEDMKNEEIHYPENFDSEEREKLDKKWQAFVSKSRNHSSKDNMIKEAEHRVPVSHGEFDIDPMLLNTQSGYVNLSSGLMDEHDAKKMFSQQANIDYSDKMDCPTWIDFLNQTFGNDQSMIDYIQKAIGYSATGSTAEQVMFILYGSGRNGKSVFMNTLAYILGSYAKTMSANSIMVRQNGGASSDIARLEGSRLVISSEVNEGMRLDESLVKSLTGGDKITARFLYGNDFEFTPQFKIWLATNHVPTIRGTDDGIWRRLMLIPFEYQVSEEQVDKNLNSKLISESMGILNWIIDGAIKWQKEGLNPPDKVKIASQEYRDEMDVITMFVRDNCTVGEGLKAKGSELYMQYKKWATENNQYAMSNNKFGKEMEQKFEKKKSGTMWYLGLRLNQDRRLDFLN